MPLTNEVIEAYYSDGIALGNGWQLDDFKDLVSTLGRLRTHRDSTSDGTTLVRVRDSVQLGVSALGFTNSELLLHTDGSSLSNPPRGVGLFCEKPATSGGEATLCSVSKLVSYLEANDPELLSLLFSDGAAVFLGAGGEFRGSILSKSDDGTINARLRLDKDGFFNSQICDRFESLKESLNTCSFTVQLNEGDFYLIDNRKWLHGRKAFKGRDRIMVRFLFD